jgi:hypothetical protein
MPPFADSNALTIAIASGPAWTAAKNSRQWYQPVTSTLLANKPSPEPPSAGGGGFETITVWSGGAYNQARKSMMIWGGGHSAYSGNELYEYRLGIDAPAITRMNNPTPTGQIIMNGSTPTYADGRPVSCHSGDHIACDNAGNFWTVNLGRCISQGASYPNVFRWVPGTDTWLQTGALNASSPVFQYAARNAYYALAHDSVQDRMYWIGQMGSTGVVNCALTSGSTSDFYTGEVAELDQGNERTATFFNAPSGVRALILLVSAINRIFVMNVDNPAGGWTGITPSGSPGLDQGAGIQWHTASGGALVWGHGTNRQNLWKLNPPTATPSTYAQLSGGAWSWSSVAPLSGAIVPTNPRGIQFGDSSGTYKRFGIIRSVTTSADAVCVLNDVDEQPFVQLIPSTGV